MSGFVSLVGAGPGDPDLLTQRAVRRLAEADVVFYDALVSPEVLPLAPHAQLISVGKRHGKHSVSQETIERCLVRAARRGKRVVRLKAGDPFVFGRGGEEALALIRAGIPFALEIPRAMLVAHYDMPGHVTTMRHLARAVCGTPNHRIANRLYGGFAARVRRELDVARPAFEIAVFATWPEPPIDELAEFACRLRPGNTGCRRNLLPAPKSARHAHLSPKSYEQRDTY